VSSGSHALCLLCCMPAIRLAFAAASAASLVVPAKSEHPVILPICGRSGRGTRREGVSKLCINSRPVQAMGSVQVGDSPVRLACESSARASGSAAYFGGLRLSRDALAQELECLFFCFPLAQRTPAPSRPRGRAAPPFPVPPTGWGGWGEPWHAPPPKPRPPRASGQVYPMVAIGTAAVAAIVRKHSWC